MVENFYPIEKPLLYYFFLQKSFFTITEYAMDVKKICVTYLTEPVSTPVRDFKNKNRW